MTELTSWHHQYERGVCHARWKSGFGLLSGSSEAMEPLRSVTLPMLVFCGPDQVAGGGGGR
jgi:hypothetical protein